MASILDRIKDKQLASQTADRINYGRGIMAARAANNPDIDSQGFNRDILNQMYGKLIHTLQKIKLQIF